ncbi:MAG: methyltransferase domain-containing protein, partial [Alphaproteobacteria bacterium]|nr:methyltransferase domain-containing protein [Alphaproteobacteria bacterium]
MYTKAIDLKEFYDGLQGRVVQRLLRQHLRRFWGDVKGQRVLGYGYATPYLKPLMPEAERVVALMPQQQGAIYWPPEDRALVSLCDEAELPIETSSIDRMLVIHGLQSVESLDSILREAWRVLTGQGTLLLVVPNRTGIWARFDHTPFGHGAPYSMGQIRGILKDYMFIPERAERALFVPPSSSRLILSTAPVWEKLGSRFFNAFGGVNIIEAGKQVYAGTPLSVTSGAR